MREGAREEGREGRTELDKTLNSHLLDTRGDQSCELLLLLVVVVVVGGRRDDKRYGK